MEKVIGVRKSQDDVKVQIKKRVLKNKPGLSDKTVESYSSTISSYIRKHDIDVSEIEKKWPNIFEDISSESKPIRARNLIIAFLAYLGRDFERTKAVVDAINDANEEQQAEYNKQEKTPKQRENWEEWEDCVAKYREYAEEIAPLMKGDKYQIREDRSLFLRIQLYVFLSCIFLLDNVRRNQDWVAFKIRNINKKEDNYLSDNKLIFNRYKTSKSLGEQEITAPKELVRILNSWININPSNHLLLDANMNKGVDSSKITNMLNRFFAPKKISTTMLRHFSKSHQLRNAPALQELLDNARESGQSSLVTSLQYAKKD